MDRKPILNIKSLKEQVYEYLREQMRRGAILPGSAIDMEETSKKLGVSKTPSVTPCSSSRWRSSSPSCRGGWSSSIP